MKSRKYTLAVIAVLVTALGAAAVARMPYVYAEVVMTLARMHVQAFPDTQVTSVPVPGLAAGRVVDDYWRVEQIAPDTWAIGEPQSDPDNYEYLLVGSTRALLIDAGSTERDIRPVIAGLTSLPVTVIPTHLHFDHTNGLSHFRSVAMVDLPELRARERDGVVRPGRYQLLAPGSRVAREGFRVSEWVRPDAFIDLGGRQVQVLWTPGHTITSLSVHDARAKLLFTGDLIYTTSLYAFLPDSSLRDYEATTGRLLARMPEDTVVYGAHCCRNDVPTSAPWLHLSDIADLHRVLVDIRSGHAASTGFLLRRYPVNAQMTLLTFYPLGND